MSPPIIQVTPQLGVALLETLPTRLRTTAYALTTGGWRGTKHYGPDNRLHVVRDIVPLHPLGVIQRLLASTFYNPTLVAEFRYEDSITYDLAELIDTLVRAVQADEDILTQWRSHDELLPKLRASKRFEDCVATLRYAGLGPERVDAA